MPTPTTFKLPRLVKTLIDVISELILLMAQVWSYELKLKRDQEMMI